MNETQHTLGPWNTERELTPTGLHAEIGDKVGIEIHHNGFHIGTWIDNETDGYANARLIASAPELLAACRAIADLANGQGQSNLVMIAGQARAAIAKATGREN